MTGSRAARVLAWVVAILAATSALSCDVVIGYKQPKPPFSTNTLLEALREASLRTRGHLPSATEEQAVRDRGQVAYEELIDVFLDPEQTPELAGQLRAHFIDVFGLGDQIVDVGGTPVNYAEPANLATYLIVQDVSFTELLTATYCIDNNLEITPCSNDAAFPSGILTSHAILQGYSGSRGYRRISVLSQFLHCEVLPRPLDPNAVPVDLPLRECNNCGMQGGGGTVLPLDDPPAPPRLHKAFQGTEGPADCRDCHSQLNARRLAYAKYDDDGFYLPTGNIFTLEPPIDNDGVCYTIPQGWAEPGSGTMNDLTRCCVDFGDPSTCLTPAEAVAEPAGCCWHPFLTDFHAYESIACTDPSSLCPGLYFGFPISKPADWAKILVNSDEAGFHRCMSRRFLAFAMGVEHGAFGTGEGVGTPPFEYDEATLDTYGDILKNQADWKVRPLLAEIFKGTEYLSLFE